jgi:hypothetical protein|tara:strand:+ start:12624 stop:13112 length:489 start_codon:yes stop_codon:yes gene_type:complete
MIQAIRETNFEAFVNVYDTKISNRPKIYVRHLFKFINDLDGAVFYTYPVVYNYLDRYFQANFTYSSPTVSGDVYLGKLDLIPAGYFKYEVYEVSWAGDTVLLSATTAPRTETTVLPVRDENGVVEGLVAIGKLYLAEKSGSEEVQYTEYDAPSTTNTIYYGQ